MHRTTYSSGSDVRPEIWVFGLGLLLSVPACDQTPLSADSAACNSYCSALEKCDDRTDFSGCLDECAGEVYRSNRYFEVRAECAQKLSCNLWASEVDYDGRDTCSGTCELQDCVDDGLGSDRSAPLVKDTCVEGAGYLVGCDTSLVLGEVSAQCMDVYPQLSSAYIEESRSCITGRCDEIKACLDELSDRYNTDIRLYSSL